MKHQNPQPLPIGYHLTNGYRIIGVLGGSCLLAEKHAPACPAPYAVYVQRLKEGRLVLVGCYLSLESAMQVLTDTFIDQKREEGMS